MTSTSTRKWVKRAYSSAGWVVRQFGFTEEELDFIINYDIKYRMGRESGEAEGE